MEYFNHTRSKYSGIKGCVTLYNDALHFCYMVTPKVLHQAKVLAHWEQSGIEAAMHAFDAKG